MTKKNDTVFYETPHQSIRARVKTAHRDGSFTVTALFYVMPNGDDRPGYLGFNYRMDPRITRMFDAEGKRLGQSPN